MILNGVKMKIHLLWILCMSIGVFLLTGCYESEQPIIDKGEKVDIVGSYKQQDKFTGSVEIVTFVEKKEGLWPLAHYRYIDQDGDVLLFKKLSSGLYLLQRNLKKEKRFTYAFVDFLDSETALILIADLMQKDDYIEALLKKFNIELESVFSSGETYYRLKGNSKKIIEFFDAHDKSLMAVILKLEKQN